MTKKKFFQVARPIEVTIDGRKLKLTPRTFKTGNVGFGLAGKFTMTLGGERIKFSLSINHTADKSKTWENE